jgi:hypothetical protein
MSDFNPELWGLRIRHAAGLANPPPVNANVADLVRSIIRGTGPQTIGIIGDPTAANLQSASGRSPQEIGSPDQLPSP